MGPFTRDQLAEMKRTGAIQAYFWLWEAGNPQWAPANPPPPPPAAPVSPIAAQPMEAKTAELNPSEEPTIRTQVPSRQYARFDDKGEFSQTSTSTSAREFTSEQYIPPAAFGFDDEEATEIDTPRATIPDRPSANKKPASKKPHEAVVDPRGIAVVAHNKRSVINGQLRQPTSIGALLVGPAPRERMAGPFVRGSRIWINVLDIRSGKSENVEAQVTSTMRRGSVWEYRVRWDKVPTILDAA